MKEQLKNLEDFQQGFGLTYNQRPINLPVSEGKLRYKLLKEENEEYLEAVKMGDRTEIADALGDQLYIVLGSIVSHGMQGIIEDVFAAIHESNMSKLDGNGNPIVNGENGVYDKTKPIGKVLKSDQYFTPTARIEKLLKDSI